MQLTFSCPIASNKGVWHREGLVSLLLNRGIRWWWVARLTSRSIFPQKNNFPLTPWIRVWLGPITGLDVVEKRWISFFCRNQITVVRSSILFPSLYTSCCQTPCSPFKIINGTGLASSVLPKLFSIRTLRVTIRLEFTDKWSYRITHRHYCSTFILKSSKIVYWWKQLTCHINNFWEFA